MRDATAALIAAAAIVAAALWWARNQADAGADLELLELEPDAPDFTAPLSSAYGWTMEQFQQTDAYQADANVRAFLAMIRKAEGTAGVNGYRTLFGGRLFSGFADHPRVAVQFTDQRGRKLWTSAAGAFQFMARSPLPTGGTTRVDTWDRIARKLNLPDFSPASQDRAAIELIAEAGALFDVRAGRFASAVAKVRGTWASLPGAGYAQPERTLDELQAAYINAGGHLA